MQTRKIAQDILDTIRNNLYQSHQFRPANLANFSHLCRKFYTTSTDIMEAKGFYYSCDMENLSLKVHQPVPRNFTRFLVNPNQDIQCAIYQIKPKFPWSLMIPLFGMGPSKVIEFETEFSDGSFIISTLAGERSSPGEPDSINRYHFPKHISAPELYEIHKETVEEQLILNPAISTVRIISYDDLVASRNRQVKTIFLHLKNQGWVSKQYLYKQLGRKKELADEIYREVKMILVKEGG